jgi:hypothetical protein
MSGPGEIGHVAGLPRQATWWPLTRETRLRSHEDEAKLPCDLCLSSIPACEPTMLGAANGMAASSATAMCNAFSERIAYCRTISVARDSTATASGRSKVTSPSTAVSDSTSASRSSSCARPPRAARVKALVTSTNVQVEVETNHPLALRPSADVAVNYCRRPTQEPRQDEPGGASALHLRLPASISLGAICTRYLPGPS